jgi:myosin heavy subunit
MPVEEAMKIGEEFIKQREEAKKAAEVAAMNDEQKAAAVKAEEEAKAKVAADEKAAAEKAAALDVVEEKPEDQLTDDEKKLLAEIEAEEQGLDEKSKMERGLKKSRKRIDKLTAKLREAEDERTTLAEGYKHMDEELKALKAKVDGVSAPAAEKTAENRVLDAVKQAIVQATAEDIELPREQRREMPVEDLQEWFAEDPVAANEWIAQRELRRNEFKQQIKAKAQNAEHATTFVKQQEESVKTFLAKYPNARPEGEMALLLKSGSTQDEMIEILSKKYPEYRFSNEIVSEAIELQKAGKDSILNKPNFGELLQQKVEAALEKERAGSNGKSKSGDKKTYTEEEVAQRIKEAQEMERQRLARVDTGSSSSRTVAAAASVTKLTADEEFLTRHGEKAGLPKERIERILKRHNDRMRSGFFGAQGKESDE